MRSRIRKIAGDMKNKAASYARPKASELNYTKPYIFHLDSPNNVLHGGGNIVVNGWLVPLGEKWVKSMRIKNSNHEYSLTHGANRPDVAAVLVDQDKSIALHSGFSSIIKVEAGTLTIEADLGQGFIELYKTTVHPPEEKSVKDIFNPELSSNWAEHENLLSNKKYYYYENASPNAYKSHPKDVKLISFYLPQFHPIPENDKAWGKGFTEWTNVTSAVPRFVGHQQPLLPKDLGFYDLRLEDNIRDQIELAKKYGIYGFCIYYYWFSGKKILDKPLNSIVKHKEWDFNYFICWANENWTKRWDGLDKEVIVAQKYLDGDPINFIKDVEHILLDPRYIRVHGKPVLAVYRASELKNPEHFVKVWRDYFKKQHNQEIFLITFMGFEAKDPREFGFDKGIDFSPLSLNLKSGVFPKNNLPEVKIYDKLLDVNFEGHSTDYRKIALNDRLPGYFDFPVYKSVMPSWDNDARKKGKGSTVFHNVNPDIYAKWLDTVVGEETSAENNESPMVFVNAWNEWAEGAVLEPTQHQGHALLNRTAEIISKYSHNKINRNNFPLYGIKRNKDSKLAVVVHVFYEDEWNYILTKLSALKDIEHDIFITLSEHSAHLEEKIKKQVKNAHIVLAPNRGRDILPFIFITRRLRELGYEYVLKLHTKKSKHRKDGRDWFEDLINKLLPSDNIDAIISKLESGAAIIGPKDHWVALTGYLGSNDVQLMQLLKDIYGEKKALSVTESLGEYGYFAGSMFWANIKTLSPLLDLYLAPEDFESEQGQVDGTTAHAVERLFGLLPSISKKKIYISSETEVKMAKKDDNVKVYKYAS